MLYLKNKEKGEGRNLTPLILVVNKSIQSTSYIYCKAYFHLLEEDYTHHSRSCLKLGNLIIHSHFFQDFRFLDSLYLNVFLKHKGSKE